MITQWIAECPWGVESPLITTVNLVARQGMYHLAKTQETTPFDRLREVLGHRESFQLTDSRFHPNQDMATIALFGRLLEKKRRLLRDLDLCKRRITMVSKSRNAGDASDGTPPETTADTEPTE